LVDRALDAGGELEVLPEDGVLVVGAVGYAGVVVRIGWLALGVGRGTACAWRWRRLDTCVRYLRVGDRTAWWLGGSVLISVTTGV
jgi:hypothetical protein